VSYSLGQVAPVAVTSGVGAQIAAAAAQVTQQVSKNRIIVPADCASIRSSGDTLTSFDAAKELRAGEWFIWAIPLSQTLTPAQASALTGAFEGAFFPFAAQYPVNVTTPCDRGIRDAHAEKCNREPKATYIPHKQDNAKVTVEVQKHNKESAGPAKYWVSLLHQFTGPGLDGKKFFGSTYPGFIGYRNVDGSPMFVVAFQMNPDPKVDLYDQSGAVASGNVARGSKPVVRALVAQNLFTNALKRAAVLSNLPGLLFGDRPISALMKLNRVTVELRFKGSLKQAVRAGSMPPNPMSAPDRVLTEVRDLPTDYRLNAETVQIFDSAIDQAAAFANHGISLFASLIGALFAQINVLSKTNSYVKVAYAQAQTVNGRLGAGSAAVDSAAQVDAQMRAAAKAQLENTNHYLALRTVQDLRRQLARLIQEVSGADAYLTQTVAGLQQLAVAARDSDVLIRKGLDEAIARARTHSKMHASVRRSMECAAIRKARREQETYPERLAVMAETLAAGAVAWAAKRPQADAALATYRALDAYLQEVERQIPLAWWAKPLGPLPVWGWGAVGVATFFGGAVMVRRSRKRKQLSAKT
jgi:hypothetical protein